MAKLFRVIARAMHETELNAAEAIIADAARTGKVGDHAVV